MALAPALDLRPASNDAAPQHVPANVVPLGSTIVRLLRRVAVDKSTGCWNWQGSLSPGGYGQISVGSSTDGSRRLAAAHRVAYEVLIGPIEEGRQLDHLCRNRACCNPEHLEPVTQAENIRRGEGGKMWREKTHCPKGHAYTDENTRLDQGRRFCRECHRIKGRRRYHAQKAAGHV